MSKYFTWKYAPKREKEFPRVFRKTYRNRQSGQIPRPAFYLSLFFFLEGHDVKRDGRRRRCRRHDGIEDHRASSRSCCTCEPRIPRRRAHTSTAGTHVRHIRHARGRTQVRAYTHTHTLYTRTESRARARARAHRKQVAHLIPACFILTTWRDATLEWRSIPNSRAMLGTLRTDSRSPSPLASSTSHLDPRIPNHSCSKRRVPREIGRCVRKITTGR